MSRQLDEDRIKQSNYFNRRNDLYKVIAIRNFRNSIVFKFSFYIRFVFVLFSFLTLISHELVINQSEKQITNVIVENKKESRGGRLSNYYVWRKHTTVTAGDLKFRLKGNHEYLKEGDNISINRNILGKNASMIYKNTLVPFRLPKDMKYILLFNCIPVIFTFIFNDFHKFQYRLNLYVFTILSILLIFFYYILL